MIKEKELDVLITRRNVSFYKSLGYNVDKIDTKVSVKIEDINKNSHQKITAVCEICGAEIEIRVHKYYENVARCGYYGCRKCSREKAKKTSLERYGDEYYNNKEQIEKTCLERYGVKTTLLEEKTKEKIKLTNLKLYGTEEVLSSDIIKDKSKISLMKKYGVDHFSKSIYFEKVGFNSWEKFILNKLEKYNITDFILKDDRTVDIKCDLCKDHYFNITSKNLYQRKEVQHSILCTICNPIENHISGKELQLLNFIKENYSGEIIENSRNIINPFELDIYLPDLNLAFEFNGLYWHSELYKDKNYHLMKTEACLEKGIQLIHIWENEWHIKQDIIKSMILNNLRKTINISANVCSLEMIDNRLAKDFLNKNHIDGFTNSSIKIGLIYNDELVSLMTLIKKDNNYILNRFCNKLNIDVVGGLDKLFNYFKTKYHSDVFVYVNRDYEQGKLYENLNFHIISTTNPSYSLYDCRLNKYDKPNKDTFRVFNSGKLIYKYKKV
ncbi:hypothetical protein M0Q97_02070 [Candidatus Dojkabacteria bacterium]|jgi:hypothetical protein|nr:hypothetical protein [Candidatus Dojkabacteria bacterium]